MTTITIQKGQTLGQLAKQHHTSVAALAKANHLKDPNKIIAGKKLIVSQDTFTAAKPATKPQVAPQVTPKTVANPGDGFDTGSTQQAQTPQQTSATDFKKDGRTFPSSNGYPLYSQNKTAGEYEPWAKLPVGNSNVGAIGCAMTAVTMGISGISGQTITPDQTNKQVNKVGGFTKGGGLEGGGWSSMGALTTPPVKVTRRFGESFNADRIDKELAAGRPVVVEVDYKVGHGKSSRKGHDGDGDHWILITGKTADGKYMANDPAGGKQITLQRTANGKLETSQDMGKYSSYVTTGQVTTFDRGPAKRTATTTAPTQPRTQQQPLAQGGVQGSVTPKSPTTTTQQTSSAKPTAVINGKLFQPSASVETAIRNASERLGVDYGYMKAMAYKESTFNPTTSAKDGTATGLYQFIDQTWLQMVKQNGAKYGMGDLASHIKYDPKAKNHYSVDTAGAREAIFAKRKDANINAFMGAEYAKGNQRILEKQGIKVGPTELYLAHFLGPDTAAKFLAHRNAGQGGTSAASMLPRAANVDTNKPLFYSGGRARSADEFYKHFQDIIVPNANAYTRARMN